MKENANKVGYKCKGKVITIHNYCVVENDAKILNQFYE